MNIFKKTKHPRVAVYSIDGIPFTFIEKMTQKGVMPNLEKLFKTGRCRSMNSVYPTISSVAWSSFMTGVNPGMHNIFGFIDREPNPFDMFIPTSKAMRARTLWEYLSKAGKKVVVINVPVTYPPRRVNGILISGFLATKIDKCVYPPNYADRLKAWNYRIDADAWLGRKDKEKFMKDLITTLERRVFTAFQLMNSEEWNYFHLHIMESDRICHFLWEHWENDDPLWAHRFEDFFNQIDRNLGEFQNRLPTGTKLIVMSDHGFCTLKKEVFLNKWLTDNGYLDFVREKPESLIEITGDTRAYSLIPGRVYINLKGREWAGIVEPASEYSDLCYELKEKIAAITDPDTGEQIVDKVYHREEIYRGDYLNRAADLIVIPKNGYEFKGNLTSDTLTFKGELVGMHTYDDAFLYVDGLRLTDRQPEIIDLLPTIFELFEIETPSIIEGKSLL
ncbi:MAG: alkaline phosphatase family protein [candidate division Zixibacteria bacterium]|nr:alkaline phosphatase family protein [Candidatus Tariuqbacter arcticus]